MWLEREPATMEEQALSDVDARVLRSMLKEEKLDIDTEESLRKLLERGTVKTVKSVAPAAEVDEDDSNQYSSQALKKLANTKFWRKVSAQASDVLESVGIWVGNKIEQDVKLVAALSIWFGDRVARDVARALPSTSSTKQTVFQLSNSSSFEEMSLRNELRKPADEIKEVSQELMGILKGQQTASSGRNLRSVAPSGFVNAGERQRRAYTQKRRIDRQDNDMSRIASSVVDSAWELRKELTAEKNEPGYKTAPIRNAIEAGVAQTSRLLQETRQARLATQSKSDEMPTLISVDDVQVDSTAGRTATTSALIESRNRLSEQLRVCIEQPDSWLGYDEEIDDDALRSVLSAMVLLRNDIIEQTLLPGGDSYDILSSCMTEVDSRIGEIVATADTLMPVSITERLVNLFTPVSVNGVSSEAETAQVFSEAEVVSSSRVEVESGGYFFSSYDEMESDYRGVDVEVISDDDFDVAVGGAEAVAEAEEVIDNGFQDNPVAQVLLRAADIVFFVVEKVFLTGFPQIVLVSTTAARRIEETRMRGQGTIGWARFEKLDNAESRY